MLRNLVPEVFIVCLPSSLHSAHFFRYQFTVNNKAIKDSSHGQALL